MTRDRDDAARDLMEIKDKIETLVAEAREICKEQNLDMPNLDAYVFDQITEHLENENPHNQSLDSIILELEDDEEGED